MFFFKKKKKKKNLGHHVIHKLRWEKYDDFRRKSLQWYGTI